MNSTRTKRNDNMTYVRRIEETVAREIKENTAMENELKKKGDYERQDIKDNKV